MESMLMPYRKLYRLIEGRSDRREFWMFTLFVWIVAVAMVVLMAAVIGASAFSFDGLDPTNYGTLFAGAGVGFVGFIVVFYVWALLTGVASFAVTVRRLVPGALLRDLDRGRRNPLLSVLRAPDRRDRGDGAAGHAGAQQIRDGRPGAGRGIRLKRPERSRRPGPQ